MVKKCPNVAKMKNKKHQKYIKVVNNGKEIAWVGLNIKITRVAGLFFLIKT